MGRGHCGFMADLQVSALKRLAEWLVSLDDPDSPDRRSVTLKAIIRQARQALGVSPTEEPPETRLRRARLVGGVEILTHPPEDCEGQACCVHSPSAHHMHAWIQEWRTDRGLMERTCRHGIGHPDPDHIAFVLSRYGAVVSAMQGVHGCDGCCRVPVDFPRPQRWIEGEK